VLIDADEAFLTGAVMGVMPLTKLDGQPVGNGTGSRHCVAATLTRKPPPGVDI
jgi:branched-subunit amino acid aminotransferase/4-amino-4-deoxychorismate lyase